MGIDEAGRGPVLGPMVYSGMAWAVDFDHKKRLSSVVIDDSKKVDWLNRERTQSLLESLRESGDLDFLTIPISPKDLSDQMEREESISLNEISKRAAFQLIDHFIAAGVRLSCVYIDTVGKEGKYQKVFEEKYQN